MQLLSHNRYKMRVIVKTLKTLSWWGWNGRCGFRNITGARTIDERACWWPWDGMRTMKREVRMIQEGKQEAGNMDSVGNVEGLRKSRGAQEGISLKLRWGQTIIIPRESIHVPWVLYRKKIMSGVGAEVETETRGKQDQNTVYSVFRWMLFIIDEK